MKTSISKFVARFIKGHIARERDRAYHAGFAKAGDSLQAKLTQLQAELQEARKQAQRVEIRDSRTQRPVLCDTAIYGPQRLPVTPELVAKMRAEVALAVARGLVDPPTDDQWKMIVADHPSTCVVAGAGSGKSTTLVLRVVFMVCHLGIRPADMSVFSFTRDSCKELREKMHKVLAIECWKAQMNPLDADALKKVCHNLVKTFHAALSRQFRQTMPGVQWFDMLKDGDKASDKIKNKNQDVDSEQDEDFENPFTTGSKLSPPQMELLLTAYRQCFAQDTRSPFWNKASPSMKPCRLRKTGMSVATMRPLA